MLICVCSGGLHAFFIFVFKIFETCCRSWSIVFLFFIWLTDLYDPPPGGYFAQWVWLKAALSQSPLLLPGRVTGVISHGGRCEKRPGSRPCPGGHSTGWSWVERNLALMHSFDRQLISRDIITPFHCSSTGEPGTDSTQQLLSATIVS